MMNDNMDTFDQFCILEVVGHRRLGGRVRAVSIGGIPLLQIDVFRADGPPVTQYYGAASIFALTLSTEEAARVASQFVPPVSAYEIERIERRDGHREQLREALDKALGVLRDLEWSGSSPDRPSCPSCGRLKGGKYLGNAPHAEDCRLAAMVSDDEIPF